LLHEISVLVVDDVNAMRVQIRDMLQTFGFSKIDLASNGEEAKVLLNEKSYQLILADWHMEPGNGLQLLKYCRVHSKHGNAAFVMVTAEGVKERVVEAIVSGVDDYLIKPLTPVQIQNKIYAVLVKKKVFE